MSKKTQNNSNFSFGISNLIMLLLEYLQSRSIKRLAIDLVFIILVSFTLSAAYITATNFDTIFLSSDIKEARDLNSQLLANKEAGEILGKVLEQTGASRAYIFKFHNGVRSLGGIPFYYLTMTVEATAPGVSKEILNNQRLPVSIFPGIDSIAENKCATITKTDKDSGHQFYLQRGGIQQFTICPIHDLNNLLIGFIGVDFIAPPNPEVNKTLEQSLAEYSKTITGVLLLNHR